MRSKILSLLFLFFLTSCVETVIVGTVVGGAIALSDGAVFDLSQDSRVKTAVKKAFKDDKNYKYLKNIKVDVYNSHILLTGYVNNEKYKKIAISIAQDIKPDLIIYNEILTFSPEYKPNSFNDYCSKKKLKTRLLFTSGISSSNYVYNVVDNNVYVIGRAKSNVEFKKVTDLFRTGNEVKKVISYIFVLEEQNLED